MTTSEDGSTLLTEVKAAIRLGQMIRLSRDNIDAPNVHCVPLRADGDWILVQEIYDFRLDGYRILRARDLTSVRNAEHERFSERILAGERIRDLIREPDFPLPLSATPLLFSALVSSPVPLTILDFEDDDPSSIFVGRVVDASEDELSFLYVDPLGVWDDEPETVSYSEVTGIRFGDAYTSVLAKYIEAPTIGN